MRFYRLIIFLVFSISSCFLPYCYAQISTDAEKQYVERMQDIFQEMPALNIWPQNDIYLTPTFFHFSNHHTYAFQFKPTNPNWKKLNTETPIYFLEHDEYHLDNVPLGYGNIIDNQSPTYIFKYNDSYPHPEEKNIFVALHERFHFFQRTHEPFKTLQFNAYPDLKNIDNMALSYLELRVLKEYWINHQEDALKDYIAIVSARAKKLKQTSEEYELSKEIMEGLANYFAISAISEKTFNVREMLQTDLEINCPQNFENGIDCQRQHRYYYTGAVVAFALDSFSVDWKTIFVEKRLSPREQLQRYFNMPINEIDARVLRVKQQFDYEHILAGLHQTTDDYFKKLDNHLKKYEKSEGVKLELWHGFTNEGSAGYGSAEENYFIDGLSRLQVNFTSTNISGDNHWILKTNNIPYLIESGTSIQVKLKSLTEILVNDKPINMTEVMNMPEPLFFNSLVITTPQFELKIQELPGKIIINKGKIDIKPI